MGPFAVQVEGLDRVAPFGRQHENVQAILGVDKLRKAN